MKRHASAPGLLKAGRGTLTFGTDEGETDKENSISDPPQHGSGSFPDKEGVNRQFKVMTV